MYILKYICVYIYIQLHMCTYINTYVLGGPWDLVTTCDWAYNVLTLILLIIALNGLKGGYPNYRLGYNPSYT